MGRSLCEMSAAGNTKHETAAVVFLHFRQHAVSRFPSAKKWYG
ncbi:hypothetical protein [Bacillus haynesii]|nr:hypothetical protein [Bacillus haynesii]